MMMDGTQSDVMLIDHSQMPMQATPMTPLAMLAVAVQRGDDLAKIEKLMDLRDRWEAGEARKAFVAAKAAFKADVPTITKNKVVSYGSGTNKTTYSHATLDNVADTLAPIMGRHGLSHSWRTEQLEGGAIQVTCILSHVLGHSEEVMLRASPDTSGSKNSIQAIGSTVSYLERYTLLAITGAATAEQDDDAEGAGIGATMLITDTEKNELVELMKSAGADTRKFLDYLGVATLDDLPQVRFNAAKQALLAKQKAASK